MRFPTSTSAHEMRSRDCCCLRQQRRFWVIFQSEETADTRQMKITVKRPPGFAVSRTIPPKTRKGSRMVQERFSVTARPPVCVLSQGLRHYLHDHYISVMPTNHDQRHGFVTYTCRRVTSPRRIQIEAGTRDKNDHLIKASFKTARGQQARPPITKGNVARAVTALITYS